MASYGGDSTKWIRLRLIFCGACFFGLLGGILTRAVQLQLYQGDRLGEMARDQYLRSIELEPRRGPIVDAHGKSLAVSVDADSIYVDPKQFEKLSLHDRANLERQLAKSLDLDKDAVHRHVMAGGAFSWLKRRMTPAESQLLRKLPLEKTGVATVREFRRYYPQRDIASHVVGMVGIDNEGLDGIERMQDASLKGSSQEMSSVRDSRGRMLVEEADLPGTLPEGSTVQLTIDSTIQQAVEEALRTAMGKTKALASMAIVMDPRTGAILALANNPTFNPNAPGDMESRRDRIVTDLYEPGSVMKCFVLAGALAEGLFTPQSPVDVSGGVLQIGRRTIHDSHKPHSNIETVTQVLATSSNVGAARIGLRLGGDKIVSTLKQFGFGERTRITLPGEGRGVLQDPKRMGEIGAATTSFGQGMTATPLQVATALSAIANDGFLMRPYIVQKVTTRTGEVLFDQPPETVRQVLTPDIAHQVREMMVAVTTDTGTGKEAAVAGFRVAGKTGTAQKADPHTRTYGGKRFSSFMGFVPAEDPRLAIYVAFDEPQGNVYGGAVAAPVFREIATAGLLQLGVMPSGVDPLQPPKGAKAAAVVTKKKKEPPPVVEETVDEDEDVPDASDDVVASAANGASAVPDLHGLSARSALRVLGEKAFEADLEGSGHVVSQKPEPGRTALRGTRVHVVLGAG